MARYIDADVLLKSMQRRYDEICDTYGYHDLYASGYDDAVDAVENAPTADVEPRAEWISVRERLPDLYGTYLVYTYDNHIKLGYFCELVIGLPPSFDDYAVTHWMPLPEPPKGSNR